MSTLEEQIDVSVPADVAWNCLHRVEDYPQFIGGVRDAHGELGHRAHLDVEAGGHGLTIDADLNDEGRGVQWQTVSGPQLSGSFSLLPLDPDHTRVQVRVEYDPAELHESFGGPKGFAQASAIEKLVREDLAHFKTLVERG